MEHVIEIRIRDGEIVDTKIKEVTKIDRTFSEYAKFIDESWIGWIGVSRGFEYAELKKTELFANDILKHRKKLKLNEVYEMLHLSKTALGEYVGWRYLEDNKTGDNYVDFGITDAYNAEFINGFTRRVVLDFNVDGII